MVPVVVLILATGTLCGAGPETAPSAASTANRPITEAPQPLADAATLKQEAVDVAIKVSQAYPDDALTFALLGSACYNTGQSEQATRHLQKCLELNPGMAEAYEVLALIEYEKGNPEETARLCRESLSRGSPNSDLLNRLGRALMDLGQTDEAIRALQRSVALPRPTSESHYLLGQAFLQSGDPARAKEAFLKAIALLPDHTQAFFGLYTASMRLGQTEEASRAREQFQRLEATDRRALADRNAQQETMTGLPQVQRTVARTFFGAAQVHRAHGQSGPSAELYRRAALLDPDHPTYRAALEAHYVQQNALAEGVGVFQQLIAVQPDCALNFFYLGRLQGRLQQFEAAEQSFRRVQKLIPDWPPSYRALAELYLRSDRQHVSALAMARRLVELEPSGPHLYVLAVACRKNNDRSGAAEAIKRAIALVPGEARYREYLQQLEKAP